jgi:hypothetical protein
MLLLESRQSLTKMLLQKSSCCRINTLSRHHACTLAYGLLRCLYCIPHSPLRLFFLVICYWISFLVLVLDLLTFLPIIPIPYSLPCLLRPRVLVKDRRMLIWALSSLSVLQGNCFTNSESFFLELPVLFVVDKRGNLGHFGLRSSGFPVK